MCHKKLTDVTEEATIIKVQKEKPKETELQV